MITSLLIAAASAQAAVAPVPPPPATGCDPFMIFFARGSAAISGQSEQMIDNIASVRGEVKSHIRVEGHADSSGPRSYNLRLSRRRAESVKAALVAKGFPKQQIIAAGRGESNALVETPDGVAEAKNRLVTVCFY